jgi:Ca2+-binding EF-hand superfamily protein
MYLQSELLTVKAFKEWEDVKELVDSKTIKMQTIDLLVKEVGATNGKMTFDQFWQLVNLLEEASDASKPMPVPSKITAEDVSESLGDDGDDDEELDPTDEELEAMAREIFDELKNSKTNKVTVKKFKAWEGVREVLDSGDLSKGALNNALKTVGADKSGELNFDQFKQVMDMLEEELEGAEDGDDDEEPEVKADKTPAAATSMGFGKQPDAKKQAPAAAAAPSEEDDEAAALTRELFDDLRGKVRR